MLVLGANFGFWFYINSIDRVCKWGWGNELGDLSRKGGRCSPSPNADISSIDHSTGIWIGMCVYDKLHFWSGCGKSCHL